jgi:3-oxoacyl-[acyl-carrier-protein] synthase-1
MFLGHSGLVCAVGVQAATACAALRAGVAGLSETPHIDGEGLPIVGAMVPDLAASSIEDRLAQLLSKAIADCLAQAQPRPAGPLPLLLGLAEPGRPGSGAEFASALFQRASQAAGVAFDAKLSRAMPVGHVAGLALLAKARDILNQKQASACLVAAVDSYWSPATLTWLAAHHRLKTPTNPDGVIPGEAAAAILVTRDAPANLPAVHAAGFGFATEAASVLTEEPLLGLGLAEAAQAALAEAGVQIHEVDFRLSDITGESYGFKEQALALSRLLRQPSDRLALWHAADRLGDTGAAAGLCHAIVACHAWRHGYAPGPAAACYASGVAGERAVAIFKGPAKKPAAA